MQPTLDELVTAVANVAHDEPDQDAVDKAWSDVLTYLVMNVADPESDPDITPHDNLTNALTEFHAYLAVYRDLNKRAAQ